jgi:hypothetical protein
MVSRRISKWQPKKKLSKEMEEAMLEYYKM